MRSDELYLFFQQIDKFKISRDVLHAPRDRFQPAWAGVEPDWQALYDIARYENFAVDNNKSMKIFIE